jgi:hypothetical protein
MMVACGVAARNIDLGFLLGHSPLDRGDRGDRGDRRDRRLHLVVAWATARERTEP